MAHHLTHNTVALPLRWARGSCIVWREKLRTSRIFRWFLESLAKT